MGLLRYVHNVLDFFISPSLQETLRLPHTSSTTGAAREWELPEDDRHMVDGLMIDSIDGSMNSQILKHHRRTIHCVRSVILTCITYGPLYFLTLFFSLAADSNDRLKLPIFVFSAQCVMRTVISVLSVALVLMTKYSKCHKTVLRRVDKGVLVIIGCIFGLACINYLEYGFHQLVYRMHHIFACFSVYPLFAVYTSANVAGYGGLGCYLLVLSIAAALDDLRSPEDIIIRTQGTLGDMVIYNFMSLGQLAYFVTAIINSLGDLYKVQLLYQDRLRSARDEAINSEKLKSVFLSHASHELRTPLHGLNGMVELALEDLQEAESYMKRHHEQTQGQQQQQKQQQQQMGRSKYLQAIEPLEETKQSSSLSSSSSSSSSAAPAAGDCLEPLLYVTRAISSLRDCNTTCKHLMELTTTLLDLAKKQALDEAETMTNMEYHSLSATIDVVTKTMSAMALTAGITLSVETIPANCQLPDKLRFPQAQVKQVLLNLLSNAIKFTEREGNVQLQVSCMSAKEFKQIRARRRQRRQRKIANVVVPSKRRSFSSRGSLSGHRSSPVASSGAQFKKSTVVAMNGGGGSGGSERTANFSATGRFGSEKATGDEGDEQQLEEDCTEGGNMLYLCLAVADTGIGVPPEKHDSIFLEFTQANENIKGTYGGTGLGLPICKNIVEGLGGEIWIESNACNRNNRGSVFRVVFPVKRDMTSDQVAKFAEVACRMDYKISPAVNSRQLNSLRSSLKSGSGSTGSSLGGSNTNNSTPHSMVRRLKPLQHKRSSSATLCGGGELTDIVSETANIEVKPLRVMIVDDEMLNIKVSSRMLNSMGHASISHTSGEEALAEFKKTLVASSGDHDNKNDRVDLILLDVSMPGMTGWDTRTAIREYESRHRQPHEPQVHIALSSANTMDELEREATGVDSRTFDHVLKKPFTKAQLLRLLQTVSATHQQQTQHAL